MNREQKRRFQNPSSANQKREEMRSMLVSIYKHAIQFEDDAIKRNVRKWMEYTRPINPRSEGIDKALREMRLYKATIKGELREYLTECKSVNDVEEKLIECLG